MMQNIGSFPAVHAYQFYKGQVYSFFIKTKLQIIGFIKAELLQLKSHPIICLSNFFTKKVGNQRN